MSLMMGLVISSFMNLSMSLNYEFEFYDEFGYEFD